MVTIPPLSVMGDVLGQLNRWIRDANDYFGTGTSLTVIIGVAILATPLLLLVGIRHLLRKRDLEVARAGAFRSHDPFAGTGHLLTGRRQRAEIAQALETRRGTAPANELWAGDAPAPPTTSVATDLVEPHGIPAFGGVPDLVLVPPPTPPTPPTLPAPPATSPPGPTPTAGPAPPAPTPGTLAPATPGRTAGSGRTAPKAGPRHGSSRSKRAVVPPEGWYPDQDGPPGTLRFWDGAAWTEHRKTT